MTKTDKSIYATLTEYASYDSNLLFGDFVRQVLLITYSEEGGALECDPCPYRSLLERLLARSLPIGQKFNWLMASDFRRSQSYVAPISSLLANKLALQVQRGCPTEIESLSAQFRLVDPDFHLMASNFSPLVYAANLELALELHGFVVAEREAMLQGGAFVFCEVMRRAYADYCSVLHAVSKLTSRARTDFVQTWPMALAS